MVPEVGFSIKGSTQPYAKVTVVRMKDSTGISTAMKYVPTGTVDTS
jgi:hypothetical protein